MVDKNLEIFQDILKSYDIKTENDFPKMKSVGKPKKTYYGNKSIAYGAIDNGLEYYAAYPMTPASTVLTEVINSKKVNFFQAEDEISVIMSALGASFT